MALHCIPYNRGNEIKKVLGIDNLSSIENFLGFIKEIENGQLNQTQLVILDEPEVHLHPEWQQF